MTQITLSSAPSDIELQPPSETPRRTFPAVNAAHSVNPRAPRHFAIVLDDCHGLQHDSAQSAASAAAAALHETLCACLEEGVSCVSLLVPATHKAMRVFIPSFCTQLAQDARELASRGGRIAILTSAGEIGSVLNGCTPYVENLRAALRGVSGDSPDERLRINLGVAYSGRSDLVRAVRRIASRVKRSEFLPSGVNSDLLSGELASAQLPSVDFLIRTGGETRLSDFLLMHAAYAELLFMKVPWLEFRRSDFKSALADYARRSRTFGGLMSKK